MNLKQAAEQIRDNPQMVQKIAQSESGQRLMSLLNKSDQDFQKAVQQAEQGDMQAMAGMIRAVMASPDGRKILEGISKELQQ